MWGKVQIKADQNKQRQKPRNQRGEKTPQGTHNSFQLLLRLAVLIREITGRRGVKTPPQHKRKRGETKPKEKNKNNFHPGQPDGAEHPKGIPARLTQ